MVSVRNATGFTVARIGYIIIGGGTIAFERGKVVMVTTLMRFASSLLIRKGFEFSKSLVLAVGMVGVRAHPPIYTNRKIKAMVWDTVAVLVRTDPLMPVLL